MSALREDLVALVQALRKIRTSTWMIALLMLSLIGAWIWFSGKLPPAYLPSPAETGDALYYMLADTRQDFLRALGQSLMVFFGGLGVAAGCAAIIIAVMGISRPIGQVFGPVFDFLGSIPNIALMPMFVALLGLGLEAKMTVVFLAALIPIVINGYSAVRQIDPVFAEAATSLGASRLATWRLVVWPMALPSVVAGLRIGSSQALTACVIAEIYTAMTGLGGLLAGYGSSFNMPRYFVVVITLVLIGVGTTTLLRRLEVRLGRYLPS